MKELFGILGVFSTILIIWVGPLVAWGLNVYRFVQCDFEESYKGEIIHGIGIVTPTCLITAWHDWDE